MKIKRICIFFILIIILCSMSYSVLAEDSASGAIDLYKGIRTDGIEDGLEQSQSIINKAITVVQIIGIFIAVAMLIAMGIKFMVGSIEDRVEVKNHLAVYLLGALVFFGSTVILQIIKNVIVTSTE